MSDAKPWGEKTFDAEWDDGSQYERTLATCRQRDELLDALKDLKAAQRHILEVMCAGDEAYMAAYDKAEAVLAKWGTP